MELASAEGLPVADEDLAYLGSLEACNHGRCEGRIAQTLFHPCAFG